MGKSSWKRRVKAAAENKPQESDNASRQALQDALNERRERLNKYAHYPMLICLFCLLNYETKGCHLRLRGEVSGKQRKLAGAVRKVKQIVTRENQC